MILKIHMTNGEIISRDIDNVINKSNCKNNQAYLDEIFKLMKKEKEEIFKIEFTDGCYETTFLLPVGAISFIEIIENM